MRHVVAKVGAGPGTRRRSARTSKQPVPLNASLEQRRPPLGRLIISSRLDLSLGSMTGITWLWAGDKLSAARIGSLCANCARHEQTTETKQRRNGDNLPLTTISGGQTNSANGGGGNRTSRACVFLSRLGSRADAISTNNFCACFRPFRRRSRQSAAQKTVEY